MAKPARPPETWNVTLSESDGVRYLHFGSTWVQGAMRVARPYLPELAYTREMLACLLLREEAPPPWPRRALVIGLGAGSVAKFLWRYRPETDITVLEIAPQVVTMARQFFKVPRDDHRFRVIVADGAAWVAESAASGSTTYDAILVDGFDPKGGTGSLEEVSFYTQCRGLLSPQGLLVANFLGRHRGFASRISRLKTVFEGRALVLPSCDSGNAIGFGVVGEPIDLPFATLRERAQALRQGTHLDLRPTLTRLEQEGNQCQRGKPAGGSLLL